MSKDEQDREGVAMEEKKDNKPQGVVRVRSLMPIVITVALFAVVIASYFVASMVLRRVGVTDTKDTSSSCRVGETVNLVSGRYVVGEDFAPGKYELEVNSGSYGDIDVQNKDNDDAIGGLLSELNSGERLSVWSNEATSYKFDENQSIVVDVNGGPVKMTCLGD